MIVNNIYFGSVIYPEVLPYFEDYVKSICEQTVDYFYLLLINDGIHSDEDISFIEKTLQRLAGRYIIVEGGARYTPVQLRVQLMLEAKKRHAEILIIGDSDDLFARNRVEEIVRTFIYDRECTFVYNELRRFCGSKAMPNLPDKVDNINQILEVNFLGLSNTALRLTNLDEELISSFTECNSFVFDWYLYSRLLIEGYIGCICKETCTYYRIYGGNVAGLPEIHNNIIRKEIEVKIIHYKLLMKYAPKFEEYYNAYYNGQIVPTNNGQKMKFWWNYTKKACK